MMEVGQGVPHGGLDADAVFIGMRKACLQRAEETPASRNGEYHAAQFA